MKRIELEGTRVETLWTTVESGKDSSGEKYEKMQRTAPRTFESAVQDEEGTLLSEKLRGIQEQLDGVSTDIGNTIERAITERANEDIATKNETSGIRRDLENGYPTAIAVKDGSTDRLTVIRGYPDNIGAGCSLGIESNDNMANPSWFRRIQIQDDDTAWLFSKRKDSDNVTGKRIITNDVAYGENLIINPDFKINQRGKEEYKTEGDVYSVDRWMCTVLTVLDNGVRVSPVKYNGEGNETSGSLCQKFPPDYRFEAGETYTLSAKIRINAGSMLFGIRNMDNWGYECKVNTEESGIFSANFIMPETVAGMIIYICSEESFYEHNEFEVEWVKLEKGSVATPFIPPDPATELLKCQRYYFAPQIGFYVKGNEFYNGMYAKTNIRFPVPMRTIPTTTLYNTFSTSDIEQVKGELLSALSGGLAGIKAYIDCNNSGLNFIRITEGNINENIIYGFAVEVDAEIY